MEVLDHIAENQRALHLRNVTRSMVDYFNFYNKILLNKNTSSPIDYFLTLDNPYFSLDIHMVKTVQRALL